MEGEDASIATSKLELMQKKSAAPTANVTQATAAKDSVNKTSAAAPAAATAAASTDLTANMDPLTAALALSENLDSSFVQTESEIKTEAASQVKTKTKMRVHKRAHSNRRNLHHGHVPSDHMDLLIETINKANLGWKADICKLQKHHHMYDKKSCEGGSSSDGPISLAQVSKDPEVAEAEALEAYAAEVTTVKDR